MPRKALIIVDMLNDIDSLADGTQVEFAQYAQIHRSPSHE